MLSWSEGGIKGAGLEEVNGHLIYLMLLTGSRLSGLPAEYFFVRKSAVLNFEWATECNLQCFHIPFILGSHKMSCLFS